VSVAARKKKSKREYDGLSVEYQSLGGGSKPDPIRRISGLAFTNTRVSHSAARNLALKNIVVSGCVTETPARLVNCFFDSVVLKGDVGRWHLSLHLFMPSLVKYASEFYADVDWALDIREARFHDAIVRGVPVDKVRRDPERHFVLRKPALRSDDSWRGLPKPLVNRLEFWLWLPGDTELLIASDYAPYRDRELARYRALREAGLLE
jgi:hypothetical protein